MAWKSGWKLSKGNSLLETNQVEQSFVVFRVHTRYMSLIDDELESYLGLFDQEQHLDENDRYVLALTRLVNDDAKHGDNFAFTYARRHGSGELAEGLNDAGDDLSERARVYLLFKLDSYPVSVGGHPHDLEDLEPSQR